MSRERKPILEGPIILDNNREEILNPDFFLCGASGRWVNSSKSKLLSRVLAGVVTLTLSIEIELLGVCVNGI